MTCIERIHIIEFLRGKTQFQKSTTYIKFSFFSISHSKSVSLEKVLTTIREVAKDKKNYLRPRLKHFS